MAPLPRGYKIVDSGDPEAPWELVGPGGRTVTISDTKKGLRNIAVVDIGEQSDLLRRQAQAMQEASGHVKPRHGHPMGTRVMLKGGEHRGVVVGHDHQGGVEMNKVRWDDGTVTTRSVGGLVPETPKPPSAGLKPNSKVRTKVGAVTKAAGVDSIQPGEVGTVGSIGGGMAQVHFTPQPGKRGSRVAHIPVADLEAADQGTTQKLKSPSSTATPSQDQRKAAERAADASGGHDTSDRCQLRQAGCRPEHREALEDHVQVTQSRSRCGGYRCTGQASCRSCHSQVLKWGHGLRQGHRWQD